MTKQAYMRGLTKKAANTDFFTSYDDRWSRAGIAGLAALLGSKALGAGWGTAGTLATILGTGAYNTHNYDAIKNRLTSWLGLGKKEQAPAPAPAPKPAQKPDPAAQQARQQKLDQQWQEMQQQARQDVEAYSDAILGTHQRPAIGPDSRTYIQQYNDQDTPVTGAQIAAKQQTQLEQKIKHDLAVALRLIKNKPAQSLLRASLQRIKSKLIPAKTAPYKPLPPVAINPAHKQINNAVSEAALSKQPGLILHSAINNMNPLDYFSSPALINKIYSK